MMNNNKRTGLFLYYIVLLAVFLSWRNFEAVPGPALRIGFLVAVLFPCYFIDKRWLPAVMTLFLTLMTHGLTTSYLPARLITYDIVLLGGLLFLGGLGKVENRMLWRLLFLWVLATIINIVSSQEVVQITESLILVICLSFYIDFHDEEAFHLFSLSFIVAALTLSGNLLLNADLFTTNFGVTNIKDAERVGFRDINYSACIVALGMVVALIELVNRKSGKLVSALSIITLIVSMIALARNASRGSLVAIAAAGIVVLWFSRTNRVFKFFITLAIFAGLFYMYTNEMFNLVAARFESDDGTGANRSVIWQRKLEAFFDLNPLQWVFGVGYTKSRVLGARYGGVAVHNDFVAHLVCYGIVGLTTFLSFFFYPIHKLSKSNPNFSLVIASMIGLFVVCMTLEPFMAGRLPYFSFWLYIIWLARIGETQIETKLKL